MLTINQNCTSLHEAYNDSPQEIRNFCNQIAYEYKVKSKVAKLNCVVEATKVERLNDYEWLVATSLGLISLYFSFYFVGVIIAL